MKKIITILLVITSQFAFAQSDTYNKELIDLAKIYRNFHFRSDPPQDVFSQIQAMESKELDRTKEFVAEMVKANNSIATKKYLIKPDTTTLQSLFIIRTLNWNMHEAEPKDNLQVIDSILNGNTEYNEMLSCYYGMMFTSVGNKNRPFDMSNVNFTLRDYNLENDTEKGIFFLESMETFGTLIWGLINIPKPPNYKKAQALIDVYPTYNGQPYYQYLDLNFEDFMLTKDKTKPKESFKSYYINKYLNTLMYHSVCLSQKKKNKEKRYDFLLSSIIKNESYWKYSDTPNIFNDIFKKIDN